MGVLLLCVDHFVIVIFVINYALVGLVTAAGDISFGQVVGALHACEPEDEKSHVMHHPWT